MRAGAASKIKTLV